jgi:lysozyme family protein
VIEDLQDFMQHTVGTRKEHPLPPPKSAANALRHQALKAISDWYHEFKLWHVELESAYKYLKNCLNVS